MGSTKEFFKEKKGWSFTKDNIVSAYLRPYIAKISTTRKPLTIIDCFAGQGKFDDGNIGSPIIIAKEIKYLLERNPFADVSALFIEKKYYPALRGNLQDYKCCEVWGGTFEDYSANILGLSPGRNLFLYIDPYGIKSLDFKRFGEAKSKGFATFEMLMNFNTFGFLREGCRLLQCENIVDDDEPDDYEIDDTNDLPHMNSIANGNYWQTLLGSYRKKEINMQQVEMLFANEYTNQLRKLFKYVVNIPVRSKTKNIPKYRLIFCTDHPDGLTLMTDNMNKRWKEIVLAEHGGQTALFGYEFPEIEQDGSYSMEADILSVLPANNDSRRAQDIIVDLICRNNIAFSQKEYFTIIKDMNGKSLEVTWNPPTTPTGRKAKAMDFDKYTITVRKI